MAFASGVAAADELQQVASFPAVRYNQYREEGRVFPDSVAWLEAYGGDTITSPFLIREGASFGVCDYIQRRVLWLDSAFSVARVSPYPGLGEAQGSGYRVETIPYGAVYLYTDSFNTPERKIYLTLEGQDRPIAGGAWFQSEVLFFFDMEGVLHVVENPVESASQNARNIQDARYAKELLTTDKSGRFAGLVWSDAYGLMRNRFPLAKTYTREWDRFFADRRKAGGLAPNEKRQLPGKNWGPKNVFLNGISADGTVFWGIGPMAVVDATGFFVHLIQWDSSIAYGPLVLPSGDILLQFLKRQESRYVLYLIRRTW